MQYLFQRSTLNQLVPLSRQNVCKWHVAEVRLSKFLPHGCVVLVQIVLPAQLVHGGELIYFDHLVQLTKIHHIAVFLCYGQRVPN